MIKRISSDPTTQNWDKEWRNYYANPWFKPNDRVLLEIKKCFNNKLQGKKIIELGAGSGSDVICLSQLGASTYGLDFSAESVKTMRYWSKVKNTPIKTVQADIANIPFKDNYFDMVYSVGLMEHFREPAALLKEQIRIIKPGGFLIIDVPQKYTLYTIAKHIRMMRNTHPFGWETEYSKSDLLNLAKQFNQKAHTIYGRDSDIISRFPHFILKESTRLFKKTIEKSFLAPYVCLCIGVVIKIRK